MYQGVCNYCGRGFYVDTAKKKTGYTKTKPDVKNKEKYLKCCFICFTKPQVVKAQCSKCRSVTNIPGEL